ncbi:unnamed protein product, partial [Mesorhabditis spiculigera]
MGGRGFKLNNNNDLDDGLYFKLVKHVDDHYEDHVNDEHDLDYDDNSKHYNCSRIRNATCFGYEKSMGCDDTPSTTMTTMVRDAPTEGYTMMTSTTQLTTRTLTTSKPTTTMTLSPFPLEPTWNYNKTNFYLLNKGCILGNACYNLCKARNLEMPAIHSELENAALLRKMQSLNSGSRTGRVVAHIGMSNRLTPSGNLKNYWR